MRREWLLEKGEVLYESGAGELDTGWSSEESSLAGTYDRPSYLKLGQAQGGSVPSREVKWVLWLH